jgi:hypothetical protein
MLTKKLLITGCAFILFAISGASVSYADESFSQTIEDRLSGGVNIRLRDEYWNTFQKQNTDTDESYNFFLIRARAWLDYDWPGVNFHFMGQAVKAFDLPRNAAFGPGLLYFEASDRKTSPGNFQIGEAYLHIKDLGGFYFKGGRIPIRAGTEVIYEDSPKLNWVIKSRLSERLIGTWDWTNIGRRFDGATGGYSNDSYDFNLFGSWVTFGGFDFEDGLWKDLDNVIVAGGSFTLKENVLLPGTQFKIFNYFYFDDRDPAIAIAGDDLKINAIGANMAGAYKTPGGEIDLLLWLAFQFGDFGVENQKALAFITEAGYQFTETPWKPWIRAGLAYASGDGDPGDSDNGTFFNMVPTNHKFYGSDDANAFSNLVDTYLQFFLTPHDKVDLALYGHLFWLASDDEVWIGGSGAYNDSVFGYQFRNPAQGNDVESDLGGEIDVHLTVEALDYLTLNTGYSHFFGGNGVSVVFDKKDQLDWFYAQAVIHFNINK